MNTFASVLIAVLTLLAGIDGPTSPEVVESRRSYQQALQTAEQQRQTVTALAKEQYLQQLQIVRAQAVEQRRQKLEAELEAAFEAKDLKKATQVDAEIKALSDDSSSADSQSPIVVKAKQPYEEAIQVADQQYEQTDRIAVEQYLAQLRKSFDAAFAVKDLTEANRIDAAINSLKEEAGLRALKKRIDVSPGFVVQTWAYNLGSLSGVTVGPGGVFGTNPYVYQISESLVLKVTDRNAVEPFAVGFPPARHGRIVFDAGQGSGSFNGDMFVSAPEIEGGQDLIYRVKPNGGISVFHSTEIRLTKGIAFWRETIRAGEFLIAIDTTRDRLLSLNDSAKGRALGRGVASHFIDDDLVITSDSVFGKSVYMTDQAHGKLLRMQTSGSLERLEGAKDFTSIPSAISIAQGEGAFGDFLYVGTADGNVYRVNANGEATLFVTEVAVPVDADIRGIDVENDQMWLATDAGTLLRVIPDAVQSQNAVMTDHETDGKNIALLDISAVGDTVVYLMDTSSSMHGSRIKSVTSNVTASLQSLPLRKQFAVISYNKWRSRMRLRLREQPTQAFYEATDLNKHLAVRELKFQSPEGTADHKTAVLEALSLKPDVIFLLTDGEKPELTAQDLKEIADRTGATTIHSIRISDAAMPSQQNGWLERIAHQSGGKYREIKVNNEVKK